MNRKTCIALLLSSFFIHLPAGFAAAPENILANSGKFRPTIKCSDAYAEKILTIPGERPEPATHEVFAKPERIAITVVANLEGFDFTEISDDTAVAVSLGNFAFESSLGESKEAVKAGVFPANGRKATFPFLFEIEKPNGEIGFKRAGSVTFVWTSSRLIVKISCSNTAAADIGDIGASSFIGLYVDDSPDQNKPNGKVSFANEPSAEAQVGFGSATGTRPVFFKGVSKTVLKRFGSESAGTLEEFTLNSVKIFGVADVVAPKLSAIVPATDSDSDGLITLTGLKVKDLPVGTLSGDPSNVTVSVVIGEEESPVIAELDPENGRIFAGEYVFLPLEVAIPPGTTQLEIVATDRSGNATKLKKAVTSNQP